MSDIFAFPGEHIVGSEYIDGFGNKYIYESYPGMTLRDYFAAKAMEGQLSCQSEESGFYVDFDKLSANCYEIADAMLEARNK